MTAVILPMASPNPLKRTFQDADFQNNSPSNKIEGSDGSHRTVSHLQPESSPIRNESLSLSRRTETSVAVNLPSESNTSDSTPGDDVISTVATIPKSATNSKRQKLTAEEQEARRVEKEAKDRQRVEEKEAKDRQRAEEKEAKDRQRAEEKANLEESKRAKEIEKEEKRKEKETQTRQREEERKKKEEAKTKKDKA